MDKKRSLIKILVEAKNFKGIQADVRNLPRSDCRALKCRHSLKPFANSTTDLPMDRNQGSGSAGTLVLCNQFSAGLEYQIELQKFVVLLQPLPMILNGIALETRWGIVPKGSVISLINL